MYSTNRLSCSREFEHSLLMSFGKIQICLDSKKKGAPRADPNHQKQVERSRECNEMPAPFLAKNELTVCWWQHWQLISPTKWQKHHVRHILGSKWESVSIKHHQRPPCTSWVITRQSWDFFQYFWFNCCCGVFRESKAMKTEEKKANSRSTKWGQVQQNSISYKQMIPLLLLLACFDGLKLKPRKQKGHYKLKRVVVANWWSDMCQSCDLRRWNEFWQHFSFGLKFAAKTHESSWAISPQAKRFAFPINKQAKLWFV